jgi:hypothetical protein
MSKKIFLLLLISFKLTIVFGQNALEKVLSKTWFEYSGFTGQTIVFVKADNKQLKAIIQINGSGVPVIGVELFDVEIQKDTIFLLTPIKTLQNSNTEKFIYIYNKNQGLKRDSKPLKIIFNEPIVHLFTEGNQVIGELINVNKITKYELDKNRVYVNEKIFIINPKNN